MPTSRVIGLLLYLVSSSSSSSLVTSRRIEWLVYVLSSLKKTWVSRDVRRVTSNRCPMPLALGLLLVLPLVGAIHRSNEITEFTDNRTDMSFPSEATKNPDYVAGFSITKILPDGELRRITRWKGMCARETIIDWGDTSVALREVSLKDSKRKLQFIYEGDTLTDCIEKNSRNETEDNCTLELRIEDSSSGEARIEIFDAERRNNPAALDLGWLASTRELRRRCSSIKSRARDRLMTQKKHRRIERSLQQMVIAPGTKWCGPHRTANAYKELGALDHADRCCRRHDHCYRAIPPFSERYNLWNYMPFTLSHCGCDQRNYRCAKENLAEILTRKKKLRVRGSRSRNRRELLLIPGTQWCGRGNRATKYTNLGGFGKADACCRRHDVACPFYIPAFESRYGLFNWGISTIMHCTCDERFRTCLKMAGTSSANFIGRIFFNVVQTKCFVLKPQKVCTKQSWWGKCEKHEYRKQAHLRDNVAY